MYVTSLDEALSEPPATDRFDPVSITFHWMTLLLLVAAFASAWARGNATDGDAAALLLELHRSIGMLIWLLTIFRLLWKAGYARSPAVHVTMTPRHRQIASAHHGLLYALLILQPVTGFLQSIWRGKAFPLFGAAFPAIISRDKGLVRLLHGAHETGATILLAMIGLHAAAALFHGLLLRDGVLGAMLPWRLPRRIGQRPAQEKILPLLQDRSPVARTQTPKSQ